MLGTRLIRSRALRLCGLAAAIASASVAVAAAGGGNHEQYRLTAAGEAAAHAAVLTPADFASSTGWTSHVTEPKSSPAVNCPKYNPKESDLVVNGDVDTEFLHTGLVIDSETSIMQTPAMVSRDWKRTFQTPGLLACLRSLAKKGSNSTRRFVSLQARAFPRVSPKIASYRVLYDVPTAGSKNPTRVMVDIVLIARGKAEITLTTTSPLAAATTVEQAEVRLATILAARVHA